MKYKNKIFCIGPNKTATTSLHLAFKMLGLSSVHHVNHNGKIGLIMEDNINAGRKPLEGVDEYDAYSDFTWNMENIKILENEYPSSLFIFTTRDTNEWLKSRINHDRVWNENNPDKKPRTIDGKKLKDWYESYHKEIRSHFKGREDYLEMNIPKGDGWEKLCPFLGLPIPDKPFPHDNKNAECFNKTGE